MLIISYSNFSLPRTISNNQTHDVILINDRKNLKLTFSNFDNFCYIFNTKPSIFIFLHTHTHFASPDYISSQMSNKYFVIKKPQMQLLDVPKCILFFFSSVNEVFIELVTQALASSSVYLPLAVYQLVL
jgi:hypothetical protein